MLLICVGGPLDGERRNIPEVKGHYVFAIPGTVPESHYSGSLDELSEKSFEVPTAEYELVEIARPGMKQLWMLAHVR